MNPLIPFVEEQFRVLLQGEPPSKKNEWEALLGTLSNEVQRTSDAISLLSRLYFSPPRPEERLTALSALQECWQTMAPHEVLLIEKRWLPLASLQRLLHEADQLKTVADSSDPRFTNHFEERIIELKRSYKALLPTINDDHPALSQFVDTFNDALLTWKEAVEWRRYHRIFTMISPPVKQLYSHLEVLSEEILALRTREYEQYHDDPSGYSPRDLILSLRDINGRIPDLPDPQAVLLFREEGCLKLHQADYLLSPPANVKEREDQLIRKMNSFYFQLDADEKGLAALKKTLLEHLNELEYLAKNKRIYTPGLLDLALSFFTKG